MTAAESGPVKAAAAAAALVLLLPHSVSTDLPAEHPNPKVAVGETRLFLPCRRLVNSKLRSHPTIHPFVGRSPPYAGTLKKSR
mmetsp:Transcript_53344/g.72888  ORF Transcript_53344/g.72888 Transcript_53344/m.72888 type:complete len:83 (+) Transcript_53344:177-425(+)